jgi:hypothetical protein
LKNQPKRAEKYEWYAKDMFPLKKPWYDQEIVVFRDPNGSSTAPVNSWEKPDGAPKPGPNFGPKTGGSGNVTQLPASGTSGAASTPPAAGPDAEGHYAPK